MVPRSFEQHDDLTPRGWSNEHRWATEISGRIRVSIHAIANYLVWFHQYWAALRSVSTYFLISFSCFSFFLLLMKWILKCHQKIYKQKRKLSLFFLFIKCYIKEKVKRILTDLHEGATKAPHPFLLLHYIYIYIYKCINWVRQKSFKPFPILEIKDLSPAFIS